MKAPILLLAFAASISAFCFPGKFEQVRAKGLAKAYAGRNVDRECLRVVLDAEAKRPGKLSLRAIIAQITSSNPNTCTSLGASVVGSRI